MLFIKFYVKSNIIIIIIIIITIDNLRQTLTIMLDNNEVISEGFKPLVKVRMNVFSDVKL